MKFRFLLLAVLASTLLFSSCTKEADSLPAATAETTYPVEGLWLGTYSVNGRPNVTGLSYSFVIYPDGTMTTRSTGDDGKTYYSAGTWVWQSSGSNIFVGTITTINPPGLPVTQRITATWSKTGIMTDGVWMDTINPYANPGLSGKFSTMQRVN